MLHLRRVFPLSLLGVSGLLLSAGGASGQDYPTKPIRIVTAGAGGGNDFVARLIAQPLTASWGQPVIVDNRPSNIIGGIVSKTQPDGYTLLINGNSHWIAPFLEKTSYDPVADFTPVTMVERAPNILVVHPTLPVKSVKELTALAKAKPGELNYASSLAGTSVHLAAELYKAMAGINVVRIPYKGTAPALNDLIGGQVQLMFSSAAPAIPHVKSGRLRALAVTSAEPSALAPDLPTMAASGVPGYESVSVTAILAPAKTPAAVINKLNQEIVRFLKTPETKARFFSAGAEVVGSTPQELGAKIKSEMATMGKMIKDAGIRAD